MSSFPDAADPAAALARLRMGNRRFVAGESAAASRLSPTRRAELVGGQRPFAVVFGCSDSRVPPEVVFDQGLGDLFVVRVAGNVSAAQQVGSIEFAVAQLAVPLVVVLGHSGCGAVQAAIDAQAEAHAEPRPPLTDGLQAIVDSVQPALEGSSDARDVERANARATAAGLGAASTLLQERIGCGELRLVSAWYSLSTGVVEFLDGVDA